jgi:hypothetical protein
LRKYLAGGIAVAVVAAFGGTAIAQDSAVSMQTTIKPTKHGTKKKPRNTTLSTTISSTANDKVTTQIDIQLPKTFKVSGKGFKTCATGVMIESAGSACPKASKVGGGVAHALAGIGGAGTPVAVDFKVTAYVAGAKKINFLLVAQGGLANVYNAPGALKKNSKGTLLVVKVPGGKSSPQQPVTGLWATLTSLQTTLGAKAGKHLLIGSTGCKHKKQKIGVTLHFGTPPTDGSDFTVPAGTGSADGSAKCK